VHQQQFIKKHPREKQSSVVDLPSLFEKAGPPDHPHILELLVPVDLGAFRPR
jgi:hypothetical protein